MALIFKNNASGILARGISATDTSIVLVSGGGAAFPQITASDDDFFYATLFDDSGAVEVVSCTAVSGDILTVTRSTKSGTDPLAARAFAAGSGIEMRVTEEVLDYLRDIPGPQGPQGPRGLKGDPGKDGKDGADGATGPQGPKGDKGDTGATGPQGPKGATGAKGDTGAQGPKGDKGATGPTGATGAKGDKGDKGDKGNPGVAGAKGDKGDKGDGGAIGDLTAQDITATSTTVTANSRKCRVKYSGSQLQVSQAIRPSFVIKNSYVTRDSVIVLNTENFPLSCVAKVSDVSDGQFTVQILNTYRLTARTSSFTIMFLVL